MSLLKDNWLYDIFNNVQHEIVYKDCKAVNECYVIISLERKFVYYLCLCAKIKCLGVVYKKETS